jgi:RHS repeat-associated protein
MNVQPRNRTSHYPMSVNVTSSKKYLEYEYLSVLQFHRSSQRSQQETPRAARTNMAPLRVVSTFICLIRSIVVSLTTSRPALVARRACFAGLYLFAFTVLGATSSPAGNVSPKAPMQVELPPPPPMRYVPGMEEPLVATGPVTEQENKDLDAALAAFHDAPAKAGRAADYDDYAKPLLAFIAAHPASHWNASLYLDIGLGFYQSGYYSRTFTYFEKSWQLGRDATSVQAERMADRAMGELAEMHARLGHAEELKAFFTEIGARPVSGPASFMMEGAHEGLASFIHRPEISYLCGPAALRNVLLWLKASPAQVKVADDARSGPHGFSLSQLAALADKAGLKYSLIYRSPGQAVPVPSIINWNVHHYAAILDAHEGHYRLVDPTFGAAGSVVTEKAADAEGSGYFLVPAEVLASHPRSGWRIVEANSPEALSVYGMGNTFSRFPGGCAACQSTANSNQTGTSGQTPPMTLASAKLAEASLTLSDTPVGYRPQKGLPAMVSVTYNARDGDQPANFTFSNLSPLWTHSWQSYVQDDPNNPGSNVVRVIRGGGGYDYDVIAQLYQTVYNATTGQFVPEVYDNSQLVRIPATGPATSYVRNLPDGGQETYGLSNGAASLPRIMFLTSVTDPAGNETTLNYDGKFRLISITDATGRKTTFAYGLSAYPLLITRITDPFGRFSSITYDANERLSSITDPIGITSSFTYGDNVEPNFVTALTTPYGTSKFSDTLNPNISRTCCLELSVAMTDPLGYVEYVHVYQNQAVTGTGPEAVVPSGMENDNQFLMWRNTYYWNAHEAASGGVTTDANGNPISENFTDPDIYHWFHQCCTINYLSTQLASHKRPLEKYRQWYNANPIPGANTGYYSGTFDSPTFTGRVLDDGSTQLSSKTYNSFGLPLATTDAIGRTTQFTYAANNIDVVSSQQLTAAPSTYETIAAFANYNAAHEPQTYTGADGQQWKYTYNAAGQILTSTGPEQNVTGYHYDSLGRLSTVENANQKTALTLTYDSADRVETRTDSEGYKLTYAYDNLDRVTKIIYPDGTTDAYDYTFQGGSHTGKPSLDLRKHTDRLGRITTYVYDADRRLTSVTEPVEGATTRTTSYAYYEDGTLEQITDPKGNVTHWSIDLQSRPISKTYAYGTKEAETETYAYEATNSRLHSVTDAMGQVKTFTYAHDNRITNINYSNTVNPTPNVTFSYDPYFPRVSTMTDGTGTTNYAYGAVGALGSLQLAQENSSFQDETIRYGYDSLGRLISRAVDSSTETWAYDSLGRMITHTGDLGTFDLTYLGQTAQLTGRHLQGLSIGTNIAYEPNVDDRRLKAITNTSGTRNFSFKTTPENLISSITETLAGGAPTPLQTWKYAYDAAYRLTAADSTKAGNYSYGLDLNDNITEESRPAYKGTGVYNSLNELTYAAPLNFTYDPNGNMLTDGFRTFKWDAENRLIGVSFDGDSARTSAFQYDGLGRRVSISGATSNNLYVWCGDTLCAARNTTGTTVRRYYPEGESSTTNQELLYYSQDQLGSVRGVVGIKGRSEVKTTYDYDPYGYFDGFYTDTAGTSLTDFRYAGMFYDQQDGLYLTNYRAYEPRKARWLSRDPLKEAAGVNLYSYAGEEPLNRTDSLGYSWYTSVIDSIVDFLPESTVDQLAGGQQYINAFQGAVEGFDPTPFSAWLYSYYGLGGNRCSAVFKKAYENGALESEIYSFATGLGELRVGYAAIEAESRIGLLSFKNGRWYGGQRGAISAKQVDKWTDELNEAITSLFKKTAESVGELGKEISKDDSCSCKE